MRNHHQDLQAASAGCMELMFQTSVLSGKKRNAQGKRAAQK